MDKVETLMSTKYFEYHFDNSDQCFFGVFLVAPLFNNCCSPTTNVEEVCFIKLWWLPNYPNQKIY